MRKTAKEQFLAMLDFVGMVEPVLLKSYEDHLDEASVPSPRDEDILSDKSSEGCLG